LRKTVSASIKSLEIKHILVPLDGSRLAESALGPAMALATATNAHITLLHILERQAPETVHGDRHLTNSREADAYLAGIASRFADAGISVGTHSHPNPEEDVAVSIATHANAHRADMIVLCAHGQGGWRDWLLGTIAQRVVRRGGVPVLMIRQATVEKAEPFAPHRIVVTVDGTAGGEAILPAALTVAAAFGAAIDLLYVVATLSTISGDRAATARLMPSATSAALEQESADGAQYLESLRDRLVKPAVPVHCAVERGEAAQIVLNYAAQASDRMIALVTHGRAGLEGFWAASVGSKVIANARGPLLILGQRSRARN
jgi:nucleotide-binding universal stress UspA family protein